ncbi:hypothetical protein ACFODZ_06765 [Marinicella sediminis]|uniref:DUF4402 domain-containing protein n=1 Tax=Marinicella sediminis TaxID=1792834 RepID=A0ABV7J9U2_9GAMM|nr:hypothetical protein [Marinicella sediminis]
MTTQKYLSSLLVLLMLPFMGQDQIDVDVDIDVGAITILYAFSDIDIEIDATALAVLYATGCVSGTLSEECDLGGDDLNASVTAVENAGDLEATFDIGTEIGALTFDPSSVDLILENVWAVRAIGGTATTEVTATLVDGTLSDGATSVITINTATATPASFTDPGLGTPEIGDVTLNLDLTGVDDDSNHIDTGDTTDVVYKIEVTAN